MTLPIPLSVRLKTARTDRHITRDLRDLTFRSVVPGGYASATFDLDRPLDVQPDDIAEYATVYVYDTRSAETVWEGRLEDPGRGAGADGQVWQVGAVGPSAHAQDRTVPLIFVDRTMDPWVRVFTGASIQGSNGSTAEISSDPAVGDDTPAMLYRFNSGNTLATNAEAPLRYTRLVETGQKLGGLDFNWDAGVTASDKEIQVITYPTTQNDYSATWSTAGGSPSGGIVVVTDFPNGQTYTDVRIKYTGAGGTPNNDNTHWLSITGMYVKALLYNANGTERTTGYGSYSWAADDIVADLLGRLLTKYDGAGASITASSHPIDQLAYPDGVTAAQVLADLMVVESGFYWAAWESNTDGLHRFEWSQWPTTVRYEADVRDGFDSPASNAELFNAVTVRWRDERSRIRRTTRTQTVTELDSAGLTRTAFLDLSDDAGSSGNATRAGDEFLAQHRYPPNAGTLTVAAPILDNTLGRMVAPWEIRPGHLIRVRGVLPRVDALNATTRDGVTVFRVISSDFNASSASATLELDSYSRTVARALATTAPAAGAAAWNRSLRRRR